MTTNEAFDEVLAAVEEIHQARVELKVKPYGPARPDLIEKYSGPERVAPERWIRVSFHPKGDEQAALIHRKTKELGWLGISFDTGGCCGLRDWELDWSFAYRGVPDGDREAAQDAVEDLIGGMEHGTFPLPPNPPSDAGSDDDSRPQKPS